MSVADTTRESSPTPVPIPAGRRTLPPTVAFGGAALAFAAFYLAAGAPTPLLVVFERQWGFPPSVLTLAFAVYAIALLGSLLVFGSLSDHVGRRPVLVAALIVELGAMLLFVFAPDIGWVIAARVVQGVATGAATSAFTASVVELAPERFARLGSVVGSIAPAGGLGVGALLTGAAVQFSAHANLIVFGTLTVIMVLGTAVAASSAETATRRPGARRALVPKVSVPAPARREFAAAVPVHLGAWMLSGLVMGLAPTIVRDIFAVDSGLVNGATAFLVPASAAVSGLALGRLGARDATLLGGVGVLAGTGLLVISVATDVLPLLWVAGVVGGVGFGASFSGALRSIAPLAQPHQRAGLFAAVYLVAYLAFGVPTLVAGLLVAPVGLLGTVLGYAVLIITTAAVGLLAQARLARR
ncbi:MAG TPA: MFS transporter [Pseudonocardia sp.]|jgi:MFS family permease